MKYESLYVGARRREDLKLQVVVVRETLDLINKEVIFTGPTKNNLDEKHVYEENQDNKHWPSTRKTEGINDQRKKTTESNNSFGGNHDQNIGRHSDKSHDLRCTSSTVITIEEKVIYEKQQETNKSTGKKEAFCEYFKKNKVKILFNCGVIGLGVLVFVWFCALSGQTRKRGDTNELDFSQSGAREKRDTSTDKWNIDTPVLKTDEPLCVSFRGIDKLCSVNIDSQTIYSDAVQNGSIRVYALGKLCKLCLHNFHLDNHTIHRQIQVDAVLNRIADTSLRDIVKTGLVVYETAFNKDKKVELTFSKIGQQANCFFENNPKTKVNVWRTQLIYAHNESVTITHTRIVYDNCISFNVNCTAGKKSYSLNIPKCPLENKGNGKNLPLILYVSIAVFLLLVVISVAVICWRRKKNKKERPTTMMMTSSQSPRMVH